MRFLICYIKAFIDFSRYGIFIPHTFSEINREENQDIFVNDGGFRPVNHSYEHIRGERLIKGVTITTCACTYCGKIIKTWQYDDVPTITDDWWN